MDTGQTKRRRWPLMVIGASAGAAVWSGWVGLGELVGFGVVHPLPGIWDDAEINTAITLPIGVEAYAVYALSAATGTSTVNRVARRFAWISSVSALLLGMAGQVAYHLMAADGYASAPWPIVAGVSCLPVVVLGAASVLWHLTHTGPMVDQIDGPGEIPVEIRTKQVDQPKRTAAARTTRTTVHARVDQVDQTNGVDHGPDRAIAVDQRATDHDHSVDQDTRTTGPDHVMDHTDRVDNIDSGPDQTNVLQLKRATDRAEDDPLWTIAVEAARTIRSRGGTITKRSMGPLMRSDNQSCNNERLLRFVAALRDADLNEHAMEVNESAQG